MAGSPMVAASGGKSGGGEACAWYTSSQNVELPFVSNSCPHDLAQFNRWDVARFKLVQKLGTGFASNVYLATDQLSGQQVALKSYHKASMPSSMRQSVYTEIAIHGSISHPHVLPMYAAFQDSGFLIIILRLADDGDLYKRLPDIRRDERIIVRHVAAPLLSALATVHSMGIIHRDLKPENVFLQGSTVFLADFGFAVWLGSHRPVTRLGTLHFMAPEVLLNDVQQPTVLRQAVPRPQRAEYGAETDIWSLGAIIYEVITRVPPFEGSDEPAIVKSIMMGPPSFPDSISDEAVHFLSSCLSVDCRSRPTAMQLFEHPWIRSNMPEAKWHNLHPSIWAQQSSPVPTTSLSGDASNQRVNRVGNNVRPSSGVSEGGPNMLSSHIAPSESSFTQGQGHRARHQAINSRWASSKAGSVAGGNPATLSQIGAGSEAGDAHRLSGRHSGHISTTSAPGQRVGRTRHRSHEGAAGGITKAKAEEAWGPEEGTSGEVARCSDGAVAARAASDDGAEGTETARSSGKGTKQPNLPTVHSEDEAVGGKKRKGKKKKKKKKVVSEKRGLAWGRKKREAPIVEADEGTEGTGEGTMKTAGQSSGGEVPVEKEGAGTPAHTSCAVSECDAVLCAQKKGFRNFWRKVFGKKT